MTVDELIARLKALPASAQTSHVFVGDGLSAIDDVAYVQGHVEIDIIEDDYEGDDDDE